MIAAASDAGPEKCLKRISKVFCDLGGTSRSNSDSSSLVWSGLFKNKHFDSVDEMIHCSGRYATFWTFSIFHQTLSIGLEQNVDSEVSLAQGALVLYLNEQSMALRALTVNLCLV